MSDPVAEAAAQIAAQEQEAGTPATGEPQTADTLPSAPAPVAEAPTSTAGSDAPQQAAELPNAAPAAVESTTAPASAPSADGANTMLPTAESFVEPPHVRIAAHLEAIYLIAKDIPHVMVADTGALKTHVGDILHRISNGMAVTEGEMVRKLEALYRML